MRVIRVWDEHNYDPHWRRFVRHASRAIIPAGDGRLAMVKSRKEGFYTFPGGGVKRGESRIAALIRETREEAGLVVIHASIREYGVFREVRKSIYEREIFDQRTYYYLAGVQKKVVPQRLEPYEKKLGLELELVDPYEACRCNIEAAQRLDHSFLRREISVLGEILEKGIAAD